MLRDDHAIGARLWDRFNADASNIPREMRHFLDHNPGMRSRFDDSCHFRDPTTEELLEVSEQMLAREGLRLGRETRLHLATHFHRLLLGAGDGFGNAREARTLVRKIVRTQRLRIARHGAGASTPDLVLPEDVIPHLANPPRERKKEKGF
jgi:stage V sporulation protein K